MRFLEAVIEQYYPGIKNINRNLYLRVLDNDLPGLLHLLTKVNIVKNKDRIFSLVGRNISESTQAWLQRYG